MKHKALWMFIILFSSCFFIKAQIIQPNIVAALPASLSESSGIEVNNANSIWTHNDSGDSARIFKIDTTGTILRIICLQLDTAKDCEESTQDSVGNYYIGDFGNNNNDRTDLRIYKIPNPDSIASDTITPKIIRFHFPDQHLFPPPSNEQNFDCEAMFHYHDSLYLFSKNRGTSSYCKMYRLPDQEGDYTAELIDSFDTGTWVTSADISPDGTRMALLSETNIWLFTDIEGSNFFGGNQQQIQMYITQKEAIVFVNDSLVYITDERYFGIGGNLYALQLASWINALNEKPMDRAAINVFPNPAQDEIRIEFNGDMQHYEVEIFNILGQSMLHEMDQSTIQIAHFQAGLYYLVVTQGQKILTTSIIKK